MKYNYTYKITNLITNEYYYGCHSTDNLFDGYLGSGVLIKSSVKMHGEDCFEKEILMSFRNVRDMFAGEKLLIKEKDLCNFLCLNLIPGGKMPRKVSSRLAKKYISAKVVGLERHIAEEEQQRIYLPKVSKIKTTKDLPKLFNKLKTYQRKELTELPTSSTNKEKPVNNQESTKLILNLPFPPSINDYYGMNALKAGYSVKYVKIRGKEFQESVAKYVSLNAFNVHANVPLKVSVILNFPRHGKNDLDNRLKGLFDSLTMAGVWEDDSLIDELHVYRGVTGKTTSGAVVSISEVKGTERAYKFE